MDPFAGLPTDHGYATVISNAEVNPYVQIPSRVLQFASQMDMKVFQLNAHRMFGPCNHFDSFWEPEAGSEIFIGRIPRHFEEPELVPFLQPLHIGPFFQLRLMMDFSGTNKGYGFVKYFDSFQANRALIALNGLELQKGRPIIAEKSVDNRRLILGGFPIFLPCQIIKDVLMYVSGAIDVQVHTIWAAPGAFPKGLAFVTYESHRAAALARKRMISNKICLWGVQISADWAEPDVNFKPISSLNTPEVLHIRNISPFTSVECFYTFLNFGCGGIKKVQRLNNQVYLHFETRFQAEAAKAALNGHFIHGRILKAEWIDPDCLLFTRRRLEGRQRRVGKKHQQLLTMQSDPPADDENV